MMDIAQRKLIEKYQAGKKDIQFETRLKRTIELLTPYVDENTKIYDLGPDNLMRRMLANYFGCHIDGSGELDLNYEYADMVPIGYDLITSFEVFEHLFNLYPLLDHLKGFDTKLVASVPLRFPFANQYWTPHYHDRHYNEFGIEQFRWVLREAGFSIQKEYKWYLPPNLKGVRPILRSFLAPSWLAITAE